MLLTDLKYLETHEVHVDSLGTVYIHRVDSKVRGRTSQQHGVAWWVNKRLVGTPSWKGIIEDVALLDARTSPARKYTFVVEADILDAHVREDWSGFRASDEFHLVASRVNERIGELLHELFESTWAERSRQALRENNRTIRDLSRISQNQIARFVREIQKKSPTITTKNLSDIVEVLARLEKARTGYTLLEQLAQLNPRDLDALSQLVENWSIHDAQTVLGELEWRLKVIQQLEEVVETKSDELHEVHPLFENGLWIFGPEYEGVNFLSNKTLRTVVREFFKSKGEGAVLSTPRRRPDLVALPDSSISIYSRDSFDDRGEVNGTEKVLIVELKRGGFEITMGEVDQARDYAIEIQNNVEQTTEILCFVLGTTVGRNVDETKHGTRIRVLPRRYSAVLKQAHARTFFLANRIRDLRGEPSLDPQVAEVLRELN